MKLKSLNFRQRIVAFIFSFVLLQFSALGQKNLNSFLNNTDAFFSGYVQNGLVDYEAASNSAQLPSLIQFIADFDASNLTDNERKAYYINTYNLLVINSIANNYPVSSVEEISGFFDSNKHIIGGKKMTLNDFEKGKILKEFKDPNLHFVLVCGAVDCPPIIDRAYRPETLDSQLQRQTEIAVNNPNFIKQENGKLAISQIFRWYQNDFGGSTKNVLAFINKSRTNPIPVGTKFSYYTKEPEMEEPMVEIEETIAEPEVAEMEEKPVVEEEEMIVKETMEEPMEEKAMEEEPMKMEKMEEKDTSIEKGNNSARYVVSSVIPKGTTETKLFNNLYTQESGNTPGQLTDRATFFTSSLSALYGVSRKLNVGLDARYRRVRYDLASNSALDVFSADDGTNRSRQGLTTIGPKIRWAPVEKFENFSIQSAIWFNTSDDLQDTFIDWDSPQFLTQLFNDASIGDNFSLFTELDFYLEDIGGDTDENRFSTPATVIFSYFPNQKTTLYALGGYSPFWQEEFDYFTQYGLGAKYQFSPNVELELLATNFDNKFLNRIDGNAGTYNIGFRFSK